MFRTDLNHLLQSIDSHAFYKFMEYVSFMGTIYMLVLVILILVAGVNLRKGFLVFNILGWGVLLMLFAKNYIDYPRPIAVDSTLESYNGEKTNVDYTYLQPKGFFEGFSDELLAKTRAIDIGQHGFPSGHVMIITAVWIAMAVFFKKRWLWIISISLVVLTIISRMYLGVHYLGDVIGGLLFGVLLVLGFYDLFQKLNLLKRFNLDRNQVVFLLLPLILLLFFRVIPGFQSGALIGFNLAFLTVLKIWGEPKLPSSSVKRILNTLLFAVLFFASYFLAKLLPLGKTGLVSIIGFTIINFVVVFVFFFIARILNFYKSL
jgi:membrane-associated phospholipid phosphatase